MVGIRVIALSGRGLTALNGSEDTKNDRVGRKEASNGFCRSEFAWSGANQGSAEERRIERACRELIDVLKR